VDSNTKLKDVMGYVFLTMYVRVVGLPANVPIPIPTPCPHLNVLASNNIYELKWHIYVLQHLATTPLPPLKGDGPARIIWQGMPNFQRNLFCQVI
jgi:hypothetical protein